MRPWKIHFSIAIWKAGWFKWFTCQWDPEGTPSTPSPQGSHTTSPLHVQPKFQILANSLHSPWRDTALRNWNTPHCTFPCNSKHSELNQQSEFRDKLHLEIVFMYQKTNYCQVPPQQYLMISLLALIALLFRIRVYYLLIDNRNWRYKNVNGYEACFFSWFLVRGKQNSFHHVQAKNINICCVYLCLLVFWESAALGRLDLIVCTHS